MAVLTILVTGAARRPAVDPAPPATMPKRPCNPNPPACRAWDRVTLGNRPWSGAGERSAAVSADFRAGTSALGSGEFEVESASAPPGDSGVGGQVGFAEDG